MSQFTRKFTSAFVIGSLLMHVFCCGLPLIVGITNLAALVGIAGASAIHAPWFDRFEFYVMVTAGAMLLVTGLLQFISNRINCRTEGSCVHPPCDEKKTLSERLFQFSVVLYGINLLIYFVSH